MATIVKKTARRSSEPYTSLTDAFVGHAKFIKECRDFEQSIKNKPLPKKWPWPSSK